MHETYLAECNRPTEPLKHPVRPGTIGAGPLARMTAIAVLPPGGKAAVLEKNPHRPAAQLSPACAVGRSRLRPGAHFSPEVGDRSLQPGGFALKILSAQLDCVGEAVDSEFDFRR
jgi:hypothetical protein